MSQNDKNSKKELKDFFESKKIDGEHGSPIERDSNSEVQVNKHLTADLIHINISLVEKPSLPPTDQRRAPRADIETKALVYNNSGQHMDKTTTVNISQTGLAFISTSHDFSIGQEVVIEFSGSNNLQAFTVKSKVANISPTENQNEVQIGVKFEKLSLLAQKGLQSYIINSQSED